MCSVGEHISGTTSFVDRMNLQAQSLGLTDTHFVIPMGFLMIIGVSAHDLLTLVSAYQARFPRVYAVPFT